MERSYKKARAAASAATTAASPVTTKPAVATTTPGGACALLHRGGENASTSVKWRWQNEEEEKNTEKAGRSKAERAIEHAKSQSVASVARRDNFNTGMASSFPTSPFLSPPKRTPSPRGMTFVGLTVRLTGETFV